MISTLPTPAMNMSRALAAVLRLLALMLLAKLILDLTDAVVSGWIIQDERLWATLLLSVPTLVLLLATISLARNENLHVDTVKRFLVATMIVIALQVIIRPMALAFLTALEQGGFAQTARGGGFSRSRTRLQTGVLFMMIPAVVGAWVSGRRGAARWALLGILISGIAIVVVNENDLTVLELLPFVAEGVALVLLTIFVGSLADQEREEQTRLQEANRLLAEQAMVREQLATSRERMRMARDLHDTVAHSLAGLVFQLDALGTMLGGAPEAAQHMLARAKSDARNGLANARAAITDLRARLVEDSGLILALQQHIQATNELGRVPVTLDILPTPAGPPDLSRVSNAQADALFRIAQEAIHNGARHAQATHIRVTVAQEHLAGEPQPQLVMRIADDGVGFDQAAVKDGHYGLHGMRERAELAGARLKVDSSIGKGTILSVTLPLNT